MHTLREQMDGVIQARPLLGHSLYSRWEQGALGHEELKGYVKEYYAFEQEFPRFISAVHTKLDGAEHRRALLSNLNHEEFGNDSHSELWLRFAGRVGVSRPEVENHFHSDETEYLLRVFRKHAHSSNPIDGLACLYAYDRQQPEVAKTKRTSLERFYGIDEPETLAFFDAHALEDTEHSDTEASILEQLCDNEQSKQRAATVVAETTLALYEFLDGVERRYQRY